MNPFERNTIITAIDIGTTKISVLVAQISSDHTMLIKGIGKAPCQGLKKGVVVDIKKTVESIIVAVAEAEIMSNMPIEYAIIGVSGSHIKSQSSLGMAPIKKGTVSYNDVEKALAAAKAIMLPDGQQILHVLPRYFRIDGKDMVQDPIDMHGVRLEVEAHIITGSINSVKNLITCCQEARIEVVDIVLEQIASGHAVLSADERQIGACVIDIGGGTTDIAIYYQNAIYHTHVIPIAGNHFTHDLAVGIRTTQKEAESIKKEYGIVWNELLDKDLLIEVEQVQENDRQVILQSDVYAILMPRAYELLMLIHDNLASHQLYPYMRTGIVLTGGGSLLRGMQELAEKIFQVPVRIGNPHISTNVPELINNPSWATGYGMILYELQKTKYQHNYQSSFSLNPLRILDRMKHWITDIF